MNSADINSVASEAILEPRKFMKSRRPYLFSDSQRVEEPFLSRSEFDYLLSQITARQDEIRFEHFCRNLAKREICPNLVPHTGPTGGGDGKTDSETIPVSKEIAALWYVSENIGAAEERWAFAFSATKSWRTKAKSDIEKIVGTDRGYCRIYFITNQYVASKKRSDLQDELKKKYAIDVFILDKTWILDSVIDNKRWDIVQVSFGLDDRKLVQNIGPRDYELKQQLADLEKTLEESTFQGEQFAEDCLEAALLARNIELPEVEVVGRFQRAFRAAKTAKNSTQLFRILYKWAWTSYWWYKDFPEFSRLYEEAAVLVSSADSSFVLEYLVNLCQVGLTYARAQNNKEAISKWLAHAKNAETTLMDVTTNNEKSGNGLWAKTQLVILQFLIQDDGRAITTFAKQFKQIMEKAERYYEYPIQAAIGIVEEFGSLIINDDAFEDLYEYCMELKSSRVSQSEMGNSRLRRGCQLLESNKIYRAIDNLAKAQILLAKEESFNSHLAAISFTGQGYAHAGLFWAARANRVIAASQILKTHYKKGLPVSPFAVNFMQEIIASELSLGRVLPALHWLDTLHSITAELPVKDSDLTEHRITDLKIARIVLESSLDSLSELNFLPKVFKDLGMPLGSIAFLFAIGEIDKANSELEALGEPENLPSLDDLIKQIVEQTDELMNGSRVPDWYLTSNNIMQSKILGCQITLEVSGILEIFIGETIFAYIESLFSTSVMLESCIATTPELRFKLQKSANECKARLEEDDCGELSVVFEYCYADLGTFAAEDLPALLLNASTKVMEAMHMNISTTDLEDFCKEHKSFERATFSVSALTSMLNVFGETARYFQSDWATLAEDEENSLRVSRKEHWSGSIRKQYQRESKRNHNLPELSEFREQLKHSDIAIHTVLNLRLWDNAKWQGAGFELEPYNFSVINLLLLFGNADASKKIFRGWRKRIGTEDKEEWLGLTVIKGIDRKNPFSYRLVLTVSDAFLKEHNIGGEMSLMCSRIQDQHPTNSRNLDGFLYCYEKAGWYDLAPGILNAARDRLCTYEEPLSIRKRRLRVIDAWSIKPNDPMAFCLTGITSPVIPQNVSHAPFEETMKHLRYQKRSRDGAKVK